eukprot:COSAG02_NODE_350_length_24063_cov_47.131447_6_plen_219_part_00
MLLARWLFDRLAGWLAVRQGFPFLAVALLAVCFYAGGGLIYARQVQKSTTVGWMAHPHAQHWKETISLVVDGMSFVGSKGGVRARSRSGRHSRSDDSSGENSSRYERIGDETSAGGKEKRSKQPNEKGDSIRSEKKKKKDTSKSSSSASRKEKSSESSRTKSSSKSRDDTSMPHVAAASSETEAAKQRMLQEQVELSGNLHQSQAKIKVVGLNESAEM